MFRHRIQHKRLTYPQVTCFRLGSDVRQELKLQFCVLKFSINAYVNEICLLISFMTVWIVFAGLLFLIACSKIYLEVHCSNYKCHILVTSWQCCKPVLWVTCVFIPMVRSRRLCAAVNLNARLRTHKLVVLHSH
jgi:hypothetical protein